ncbi:MAG: hypothetical protein B6229_01630 [Spirochaetaceae bacterium 4572_7]|nr:MAG: hypothetical protein B6229_01630 [Spirochaetaceae bacterium 4572_7]
MDKYGNVSKQLKYEHYRIVFCDNAEIDTDTFFDESFIHNNLTINNFIAHFNTIPFIVNIAKENKDHEIYKIENFLGYIDLLSTYPILKSHLSHLSKNIKHYNQKHRPNNIRSHFSEIDLHFFLTFSNGLIFSNKEGDVLDINYVARKIF